MVTIPRHDDMLGQIRSAISGGAVWATAQIRDTGFILGWLAAGQDDFVQLSIQINHRRKLSTPLDSLHIHYVLTTAPNLGDTVILDYAYTWINPGSAVPALSGWTAATYTHTFTGTEGANQYGIMNVVTDIAAPVNEGYGGMILMRVVRNSTGAGSDSYAGNFGILDADAHSIVDRLGSINEASD